MWLFCSQLSTMAPCCCGHFNPLGSIGTLRGTGEGPSWTGPPAVRGTPCKLTFAGIIPEAPRPPGALLPAFCAQAAASPVALLFKRRGLSRLPGTEVWLQHVSVGGGRSCLLLCHLAHQPIFYSLTLMASRESHGVDTCPSWGPCCLSSNAGFGVHVTVSGLPCRTRGRGWGGPGHSPLGLPSHGFYSSCY